MGAIDSVILLQCKDVLVLRATAIELHLNLIAGRVCHRMKSILLVEDRKFLRLASERARVRAGYSVVSTDDGEQALREAQERIPDLILLDMLLPRLGGPEVLRALKKNPITAQIPVVVLSSLSQKKRNKTEAGWRDGLFREIEIALGH
jgi:CheY-like chemotaxis protein